MEFVFLLTYAVVYFGICFVFGHFTRKIAEGKGYSSMGYFWLGFFLNLIGLIIASCLRDQSAAVQNSYESTHPSASPYHNIRMSSPAPTSSGSWTCAFCQSSNPSNLNYCLSCRRDRSEMQKIPCPSCGKPNTKTNEACWVCNAPLHGTPVSAPTKTPAASAAPTSSDALSTLKELADLHAKGVLTDEEFTEKKSELLARL